MIRDVKKNNHSNWINWWGLRLVNVVWTDWIKHFREGDT